jgi:hypothetical protein
MDIPIIDAEIEILKIKIAYRRKLTIFQSLRSENAGEKSEFYIFIGKKFYPFLENGRNLSRQIYLYLSDLKQIHHLSIVELI